jgi:hypothetical protein
MLDYLSGLLGTFNQPPSGQPSSFGSPGFTGAPSWADQHPFLEKLGLGPTAGGAGGFFGRMAMMGGGLPGLAGAISPNLFRAATGSPTANPNASNVFGAMTRGGMSGGNQASVPPQSGGLQWNTPANNGKLTL